MPDSAAEDSLWKPDLHIPGEFQLLEQLGAGGQGCVYKALHQTLARTVAIKFFRKGYSFQTEKKALSRFQKEARAIAKLNHANIVKILQVGICEDNTPYLVYEFVEGVTLKKYLEQKRILKLREIRCLAAQILSALEQAHNQGIIHRDIKPGNIMLLPETESTSIFQVKLLDFGMARDLAPPLQDSKNSRSTEQTGEEPLSREPGPMPSPGLGKPDSSSGASPAGSPPYMSPEQCRGEKVDARSDYYSFTCVLFECLVGAPPFLGETPLHTQYMQLNASPPLPDKTFCLALNRFLKGCLSKERDQRPGPGEYAAGLQQALRAQELLETRQSIFSAPGKILIPVTAFATILLLGCLANSLISPALKESSAQKIQPLISTAGLRKEFPLSRLREVAGQMRDISAQPLKVQNRLFQELNELIPLLQLSKHRQALYSAYYFKAKILLEQKRYRESLDTGNLALSLCWQANGNFYAEAPQCLVLLCKSSYALENYATAKEYALTAQHLLPHGRSGELPRMSPQEVESLDLRPVQPDCCSYLALIAMKQKNFLEAEKFAREAIETANSTYGRHSDARLITLLADVHLAQGKKKKAYAEVKEMCTSVRADFERELGVPSALSWDSVRSVSRQAAETMQQAETWYDSQGEAALAADANRSKKEYLNQCSTTDLYSRYALHKTVH